MTTPFRIQSEAIVFDEDPAKVFEPTVAMRPIPATNEARDLRNRLWINHELLGGDQMRPTAPLKWLPVLAEMTVQDHAGAARWSADLVFVDQHAIVTVVECKRRVDTRSRREVIGQVFEYLANAGLHWSGEDIRMKATQAALGRNSTLESEMERLGFTAGANIEEFFAEVDSNLKAGRMRVVFFMDACPRELIPLVAFWNQQIHNVEAHIVELREYSIGAERLVLPVVIDPRIAPIAEVPEKRASPSATNRGVIWDEARFMDQVKAKLQVHAATAISQLLAAAKSYEHLEVSWGAGRINGSFNIRLANVSPRSLVSVYTTGALSLNLGWFSDTEEQVAVRNELAAFAGRALGTTMPLDIAKAFPSISADLWTPKVNLLIDWLASRSTEA